MIRYLTEKNVEQLLTMPLAIEAVEQSLKDRALRRAVDAGWAPWKTAYGVDHSAHSADEAAFAAIRAQLGEVTVFHTERPRHGIELTRAALHEVTHRTIITCLMKIIVIKRGHNRHSENLKRALR